MQCGILLKSIGFQMCNKKWRNILQIVYDVLNFLRRVKAEEFLHIYSKKKLSFATIRIDHYGLLEKTGKENRHLVIIVDAFIKFIRVYLCKLTTTEKLIKHLHDYCGYFFQLCHKYIHGSEAELTMYSSYIYL